MRYSTIPLHRPHSTIACQCRACLRFDYAETTEIQRVAPTPVGYEIIDVVDTETGVRSKYRHPIYSARSTGRSAIGLRAGFRK